MRYDTMKDLFGHICEIKLFVIKLSMKDLRAYKDTFYSQEVQQWCLNLMWEYIWGDKDYQEIETIFKNAKLI